MSSGTKLTLDCPLLGELVEDLKGKFSGVFEGAEGDFVQGVAFFVPVGGFAEVADEVEDGKVGAIHEGDVIVDDGHGVQLDPVLQAEFGRCGLGMSFEFLVGVSADQEGDFGIADDVENDADLGFD